MDKLEEKFGKNRIDFDIEQEWKTFDDMLYLKGCNEQKTNCLAEWENKERDLEEKVRLERIYQAQSTRQIWII